MKKYCIAPSLMCMDITKMEEQMRFMNSHADFIHVDIMDGHFVKNITLSPMFIGQIRKLTTVPIDAHLMVEYPEDYVDTLMEYGTDYITLHPEVLTNKAFRLAGKVKAGGKKLGIAISPETRLDDLQGILKSADKLTVMTVEPGFSGGEFIPEMVWKIKQACELREKLGCCYLIEIDGSCNEKTFGILKEAGADAFVVGTSGLFGLAPELADAWDRMMKHLASA